jgi:hypothetical protein
MGWMKGGCILESQTNFFPFKRSPKSGCVLDSRIYGTLVILCKLLGSHIGVAEDSSLLGCDTLLMSE